MIARERWRLAWRQARVDCSTPERVDAVTHRMADHLHGLLIGFPKDPLRRPLARRLAWFRSSKRGPDPSLPF